MIIDLPYLSKQDDETIFDYQLFIENEKEEKEEYEKTLSINQGFYIYYWVERLRLKDKVWVKKKVFYNLFSSIGYCIENKNTKSNYRIVKQYVTFQKAIDYGT